MIISRDNRIAGAMGLLGFCAAALFTAFLPHPGLYGDSPEYFTLASNISAGLGFTLDGAVPYLYRPPLFSAALGLWFRVFAGPGLLSAALFQSFVFGLGAAAAYLLAMELLPSRKYSVWAAAAVALNPFLLPFNSYVLQEPLLLCLTAWALVFSVRLLKQGRTTDAVLAGLFWGLCVLGKAVAWFAPGLLFVFAPAMKNAGLKRGAMALGLAMLAVLPWTARNYSVSGRFIPVNDQGAGALEWYVSKGAHAAAGGGEMALTLRQSADSEEQYRKDLVAFILSHPKLVLKQTLLNALRFMELDREWYGKAAGLSMHWQYWLLPFLLLQLPLYAGLFMGLRGVAPHLLFLNAFYLLYWLQYALYWGEPRFAVPVYPALLCLGILGWLGRKKPAPVS